jgi:hypothetical protein
MTQQPQQKPGWLKKRLPTGPTYENVKTLIGRSQMPEYLGVLQPANSDLPDYGLKMHAQLPLLFCFPGAQRSA